MTQEQQLMRAKELIEQRRYAEARTVLQNVDHPKAREWLGKLDAIDAQMAAPTIQQPTPTTVMQQPSNPYGSAAMQQSSNPYGSPARQQPSNPYGSPAMQQPDWSHLQGQGQGMPLAAESPNRITIFSLIGALIGGVLGAAVGAAIWAAVAYFLDMEHSGIAIILGFLAGGGAVLFSGKKHGILIALIAIVCALAGIAVGKYAAFYTIILREGVNQYGLDVTTAMQQLPPFDRETIDLIVQGIKETMEALDYVFIIAAALAAGSIALTGSVGRRRR